MMRTFKTAFGHVCLEQAIHRRQSRSSRMKRQELQIRKVRRHLTVAWMAALSMLASAGAVRAQTTLVSPEARAMAQLLGPPASREPIQSCAADAPTMLPAMYGAGGGAVL